MSTETNQGVAAPPSLFSAEVLMDEVQTPHDEVFSRGRVGDAAAGGVSDSSGALDTGVYSIPSGVAEGDAALAGLTPEAERAKQRWQALITHLQTNFHNPDIEALRVALAVANTHRIRHERPVWLVVIGPPASGKTEIVIGCVSQFPHVKPVDDLTPNTFLSGMNKLKGGHSLLQELGTKEDRSGILTFADLSVLLTKRHEDVTAIFGQLTKIYDGEFSKPTGMKSENKWTGKVTCIAAATAMAERIMSAMRATGPRFMHLQWKPGGEGEAAVKMAQKARYQRGKEDSTRVKMQDLAKDFIQGDPVLAVEPLPPEVEDELGLDELATLVAVMRTHVERDNGMAGRRINDVDPPESPTRLSKAMSQVAASHASLFRRDITLADYKLASRIAWDSVPNNRLLVMRNVPHDGVTTQAELVKQIAKPRTTVTRTLEELHEIGVVRVEGESIGGEKQVFFTDYFRGLRSKARFLMDS